MRDELRSARPLALFLAAFGWAAAAGGCIYDWSHGGAGGGSPSSASSGGGGANTSTGVSSTSPSSATSTSTSSSTATSSSSGPGPMCGGAICDGTQYCGYKDHLCGAGLPGECLPKPKCPDGNPPGPFCDCDGGQPQTTCEAKMNGLDTTFADFCKPMLPAFACGNVICDSVKQYCVHNSSIPGTDKEWQCVDLTCGSAKCVCAMMPPCTCYEAMTKYPGVFDECP